MEKQRDNLFLVKIFKKGDSFGEISLIYDRGSDGSMFAMEDTICLLLNKQNFLQIIGDQEKNSITKEIEFLQHHPLFENWSFNLLRLLYFFSQIMNYNKNEVVYLEDTKPTHIYIIKQGEFAIYRNFKDQSKKVDKKKESDQDEDNKSDEEVNSMEDNKNDSNNNLKRKFEKQKKYKLAVMGKGELFGEEDILMKQNRTFSVVCDSYNGAQLIMIKRKVFKLSVMADIGSATFIKQRLKQKNYNHQLRLESINTFIKEYKDFFTDSNDKKQNEQQNGNNFQSSNQSSNTKQENQNKAKKRNSQDITNNGQNVYQNQGFLSPPSTLTVEKSNSQNFSNSYQNERKRSFNSSTQQIDKSEKLQNHQDLFDHFSQFQKKIYKSEKNKISSNDTNSAYKDGSPLRDSQQSSKRGSILQIKFPNQQNPTRMPLTQENSPEYNFFGNKEAAYRLSINSLVTPKNVNNLKSKMDQQNMQLNNIEELAQSQQQKPIHLLLEGTKQSSRDSLNSSCFSSQYDMGVKMQKSMSHQLLIPPQDGIIASKERRVSNFYTESLVNQNNRILKKQSSSQRDSQSVDSKVSANQNQSSTNQNQRNPTSQDLISQNGNSPNQQQEYYSISRQPNQQLQYQMFNQPSSFYNLKGQLQKQDYLLNIKNLNQEQIEPEEQNQYENEIKNSNNFQNFQEKKVNQIGSKFVLSDSTTLSPNKYPLNYKMSSSTIDVFHQSELTNSQINQQNQQQFQFSNPISNATDAKKNGKKIHLQFLLNKQKPNYQKENTICSSISATMPSVSAQSCVQICSFPKENLEFNHSMSTNVNNYFSSSSSQRIQNVSNQQSVFTNNYLSVQSQPHLQEDYFQQENEVQTEKERGEHDEKKNQDKTKKKQKQFRNSIFTDTFQKTFQQNLHHIQYRILQKKHKVTDIQQSIAKHIQDQTIKHFLEENTLVKSKYDHIRNKYQQQQQQQQQQQIQPSKSETKFEALKQMLKNNLHYSKQEIEQGLTQIQSFPRQKTASNYQKKAEFQYEEFLNQQNETQKHSPNIKTQHEKSRSSFNSNFQNNLKSQQQNTQQQQYKFQQMQQTIPKQSLVLDIKQQDDQEIKNFSITPNDKTGTVHIKSLQSLTSISKKGSSNVFSFTKIPQNNEIKSKESLKMQSIKQLGTENHTKKLSLIEQNFNSLTNFNIKNNIKIKKNIQFNYKIPQKTTNS
ncbi:cyclic nucleotide-binding domain protein (macronuclear) [Tetrahymena thermophila SB210]|uniref:Cyclic nucleotide-binding domain protein n=1 Tax=Tetrahymena thermophila (strain SB210) TaxID=312017 RepID=Q22KP7_TETTS|nr:cyclic nucleotide-binding domain protein [Tetrahymena thermophila SB210]EAR85752.2 cyclic nucleotide-binding domain protein [Tetrahymena thermophila SB210]|eukprot:XP_001033415.2 cyclic nucleotide-binding domain protein [Tetrahymena thermophila SB210]